MRHIQFVLCFALVSVLACPRLVAAQSLGRTEVEALVTRAQRLRLHQQPQWLRLLHYQPVTIGPGVRSEADSPTFFLAAGGAEDPAAELSALLRAMFAPPVTPAPVDGQQRVTAHALCRFPARVLFVSQALDIDPQWLPAQSCPGFQAFVQEVNPVSVSLVFSSYYLNNPASAFGHTLLRFNKDPSATDNERRELLDYALNFSANVDTSNALWYAFKGLLGLFPGTVQRMPYYYKVREYADAESRDLWEYELNLTPAQLFMLLAHVWELGQTHFYYYYLDENCSYRINLMLGAALPGADLVADWHAPVLPADTVKRVLAVPGLVKDVRYRPSLRTKFRHTVAQLNSAQQALVVTVADEPSSPLPNVLSKNEQIQVLDAAADFIDLHHFEELVSHRDSEAGERKQALLVRRARLGRSTYSTPPLPAPRARPHLGHGSHRLGLGVGHRKQRRPGLGGTFTTLDLRLALHDLSDPPLGYPDVLAIEFLPLRLRLWHGAERPRLTLEDISLVRITSLSPVSRFEFMPSWKLDVGLRTLENEGCERCVVGYGNLGGGLTLGFWRNAVLTFLFLDARLWGGGPGDAALRLGVGPHGGLRVRLTETLAAVLTGEWLYVPLRARDRVWQLDGSVRWGLRPQLAIGLEGRVRHERSEVSAFVMGYL